MNVNIKMSKITVFSLFLISIQLFSFNSQKNTPQTNNSTGVLLKDVKEVNGKAKLDEYFSKNKRAIVEIYAPWCHHCQVFAPTFKQLYNEVIK
jgi:thiol-disulfide isomerase/thioredoxin